MAPAERTPYEWAVVRVVPRVERCEQVNVGVVVYCQMRGYLACAAEVDESRLLALAPDLDLDGVRRHVRSLVSLCAGDAAAGPAAGRPVGERFRWLTAPRSTVVQLSPVHTGVTSEPAAELDRLLGTMVRLPGAPTPR